MVAGQYLDDLDATANLDRDVVHGSHQSALTGGHSMAWAVIKLRRNERHQGKLSGSQDGIDKCTCALRMLAYFGGATEPVPRQVDKQVRLTL
jgi:hypothetical protein